MNKSRFAAAIVVCLLIDAGAARNAQAEPPPKNWELEVLSYAWVPALDAKIDVEGVGSRNLSTTLMDTIKALRLGVMGRVLGRYDRFVGIVDGSWAQLADSDHVGGLGFFGRTGLQVDVEMQSAYLQALGGYRIYEREGGLFGAATREKLFGVELLAGLTYTWLKQDVKIDLDRTGFLRSNKETRHFSGTKDWVIPFVGARLVNDITPRLRIESYGGAGGFGAGNGPDISWQLTSLLSYRFTDHIFASAGYRLVADQFDSSGGEAELDTTIHGPMLGFGVRF